MLLLCAIAIAAVAHRVLALASPPHDTPAQVAGLDAAFARKPAMTLVHVLPASLFVLLVPVQFSGSLRARRPELHRWIGRILMTLVPIIGISALVLLRDPIGGIPEVTAILVFDALFLCSMARAFVYIRRGDVARHRARIIRGVSIALGVATVRPVVGAFFATSRLTGLTPHDFFGVAFWIGFTLTYAFAEVWIAMVAVSRRERRS